MKLTGQEYIMDRQRRPFEDPAATALMLFAAQHEAILWAFGPDMAKAITGRTLAILEADPGNVAPLASRARAAGFARAKADAADWYGDTVPAMLANARDRT